MAHPVADDHILKLGISDPILAGLERIHYGFVLTLRHIMTAPKLHPLSTILTKTKHQPANANDRVQKPTLLSALVVLSSLADPGFLSTLLVSFYLLLFSFTITDTDTYSTGEPYRGVVCEDTRGLTLVRVPPGISSLEPLIAPDCIWIRFPDSGGIFPVPCFAP